MPLWATPRADRHHANPNKEDHDPDIGEGVLAFTTAQAVNRAGRLPRAIARNQAVVFFPLLTLEGLNMHAASPRWLFHARCRRLRRTELLLLLAHVLAYPGAVLWVLRRSRRWPSSPCIRRYSGSTWAARSHRTTRACRSSVRSRNSTTYATKSSHRANVRGDWFVDQVLGGLNYQIEHHLFPSMPRSHLRNAPTAGAGLLRATPDPLHRDRPVRLLRVRAALPARTRRTAASVAPHQEQGVIDRTRSGAPAIPH